MNKKTLFNLLLDTVSQMKSWLRFNNVETIGKIKIKGAEETPTLVD